MLVTVFILFLSPTLSMDWSRGKEKLSYKLNISDSAFMGMVSVKGSTIWFPREYLSAATLVRDNSEDGDIIYSSLSIVGLILGTIAERPTANALFPEIGASEKFNPIAVSKIIVFTQLDDPVRVSQIVNNYSLVKIGENKLFVLYKNPLCYTKVNIKKASVSFWVIGLIGIVFILLLWRIKN
jgi:hypothetical protein